MAKEKTKIINEQRTNKTFNFVDSATNVQLNFTLNIDNTRELKAFNELLKAASAKVEEEINNLNTKA